MRNRKTPENLPHCHVPLNSRNLLRISTVKFLFTVKDKGGNLIMPINLDEIVCSWIRLQMCLGPQTREYIDLQWPLSCVHSIMMVISAQPGKSEECTPSPFYSINPPRLELSRSLHPPQKKKLARKGYQVPGSLSPCQSSGIYRPGSLFGTPIVRILLFTVRSSARNLN